MPPLLFCASCDSRESGVHRIRVAMANMPRLLADMVRTGLSSEPDLVLVAELREVTALEENPNIASVDVLIVGVEDEGLPESCGRLMLQRPQLRLLGLSLDARRAYRYELRPYCLPLGEPSPRSLAEAVRALAGAGAT